MKKLEIKTVVKAKDFDLTPKELLAQLRQCNPVWQLPEAYARLTKDDPVLAEEWAQLVASHDLAAYIKGMDKGAELVAAALPQAQDDPDFTVKLEVIVK